MVFIGGLKVLVLLLNVDMFSFGEIWFSNLGIFINFFFLNGLLFFLVLRFLIGYILIFLKYLEMIVVGIFF